MSFPKFIIKMGVSMGVPINTERPTRWHVNLTKSRSRLVSDHIAKLGACHHHYLEDDEDEVPSTSNMAW